MNIPVIAVFTGSLLGSLHCAGMCGGFAACCAGDGKRSVATLSLYHLGRLFTYTSLGLIAGLLGLHINKSIDFIGLQNVTALITGILLVAVGLSMLRPARSLANSRWPIGIKRIYEFIYAEALSPASRSFLLGLCSGLLPCGWLFSFVALAASSGTPVHGALIMAVFWLGTVPILSLIGLASGKLTKLLQPYQRGLVAALLVLAGLWSLGTHIGWSQPYSPMVVEGDHSASSVSCH